MGPGTPITAEEAGKVYRGLPKHSRTIAELSRELIRLQTPVSVTTLTVWKRHKWRTPMAKQKVRSKYRMAQDQGRAALKRLGLDPFVVEVMKKDLTDKTDSELVRETTRNLFVYANMLMAHVDHQVADLLQEDPRGVSNAYMAAFHMVEGGVELMRHSVELAERAMKGIAQKYKDEDEQLPPPPPTDLPDPFGEVMYQFGLQRLPPGHRTPAEVVVNGNGHPNGKAH